jgi:uncharacterized protein YecE (DUF72 family)
VSVRAGTSDWNGQSVVDSGRFYPHGLRSPLERLRHYAGRLDLTEIEDAFHYLPTVHESMQLASHTPADFVFHVPVHRLLTDHPTGPGSLPADLRGTLGNAEHEHLRYADLPAELRKEMWQRFYLGVEPLRRAGKLGALILRFPVSFVPSSANFEHLESYADKLRGYRTVLEFGHRAWHDADRLDRLLDFERSHGLVHLVADEPDHPENTHGSRWVVTQPALALVRAHGPNRLARESGRLLADAAQTDHAYAEDQLQDLLGRIQRLQEHAGDVHVIFSNSQGVCAPTNAAQLKLLLSWTGGKGTTTRG